MTRTGVRELGSVARVLAGGKLGRYAAGPKSVTARFEREAAGFLGAPHALAVNSGTSALVAALAGVGVGPGDEVLVPAYTWVSTAAAPLVLGAVPVLVEVDESLTIDPADLKTKITGATKAVLPVHMLNLVSDMDAVTSLAAEHGIAVVEDACQAFGVRYRGRRVGTIGDAGAYSFGMTKNIVSGEGGLLVTADERIAVRAGMFHDVGSYTRASWVQTPEPLFVGMNLKMSELASAVLLPQLRRLDAELARLAVRRRAAVEELSREPSIRISPHHDPDDAIGLTVTFDDPADAELFARQPGVNRLSDTGRHVHLNWESIRGRRTYHERFDPYGWAGRPEGTVGADTCPVTLGILSRTCRIQLRANLPVAATRVLTRRMAGYRKSSGSAA
jgi:dTDP-4-amino-4,6-dideoxygalactose transaminase